MPAAIAIPLALGAGTAAAGIVGAKLQSGAAENAANLQSQAAQQTLDFQKQQAAIAQQNAAATQLANYGQYQARQGNLSDIGQMLGLPARNIPPPPAFITQQAQGGASPTLPASQTVPSSSLTSPAANPQTNAALSNPGAWMALVNNPTALSGWVSQNLGAVATKNPGLVNYYVQKIQQQPGANPTEQAGSANYWAQKINADPNVSGISASAGAPRPPITTAGMLLQPNTNPLTPALQMPGYGG